MIQLQTYILKKKKHKPRAKQKHTWCLVNHRVFPMKTHHVLRQKWGLLGSIGYLVNSKNTVAFHGPKFSFRQGCKFSQQSFVRALGGSWWQGKSWISHEQCSKPLIFIGGHATQYQMGILGIIPIHQENPQLTDQYIFFWNDRGCCTPFTWSKHWFTVLCHTR